VSGRDVDPRRLAELVARDGEAARYPTKEQAAVIGSVPRGASLVVAGAGSGKTTTMAMRAAWLVANGIARPEEILGLTFTRKAARELRARIGGLLAKLPAELAGGRRDPSDGALDEAAALPQSPLVSTYNAFASAVYREHALVIGQDPDAAVLSEAAAWMLARRTVLESRIPGLAELDRSTTQLVDAVLGLAHAMSDNAVEGADAVLAYAARFAATRELELGGRAAYRAEMEAFDVVRSLDVLLPLVEEFREAKRRRGVMEFSDQVAAALAIARAAPAAVAAIRSRYRFVILDEYQDTSVVQTRLLAELFRDRPEEPDRVITAVGDPNQAIYGWRGASEANLATFGADFGAGADRVSTFPLMMSWRNPVRVLEAANAVAADLRSRSKVEVGALVPRPGADEGRLEAIWSESADEEAESVAAWLRERLREPVAEPGGRERKPTAAILFRTRRHIRRFADALRAAGVECRELGVGGLFETPEATDLISGLRVLVDPDAGNDLIRLLAGPRWRIGIRDLAALEDIARRVHAQRTGRTSGHQDGRSIVDGLDALVDARADWDALEQFTHEGLRRLRAAGALFRDLRSRVGVPLLELVRVVEEALGLDIEVVANDDKRSGPANLRAFRQQVERFAQVDEHATASSFLAWVDRVIAADERIGPAEEPAQEGIVQLLTIHAAKGLEWDVVAIPRLVVDDFPAAPKEGGGWVAFGELPHAFRGDAASLREQAWFDWETATTRKELVDRFKAFKQALRDRHEREERRLGYVAVTRSARDLLLTGSFWPGKYNASTRRHDPRPESPYVRDIVDAGLLPAGTPGHSALTTDPAVDSAHALPWPRDPLGPRRAKVERSAALVRDAAASIARGARLDEGRWSRDLELLLAERSRSRRRRLVPPARIPASAFKDWIRDPETAASRFERPMPEQPYRATRLGTLFHAWVEERYRNLAPEALFELRDLPDPVEDGDVDEERASLAPADEARLAELKATFERSEWAFLAPMAIETAIELPFDGRSIPAKIDAVFRRGERIEIVDWKTGKRPTSAEELAAFDYQLDLYRVAWSARTGTPLEAIDVAVYFVGDDVVHRPSSRRTADDLLAEWRAAVERLEPDDPS